MNKTRFISNLKLKAIFLSLFLVIGFAIQFTNLLPVSDFTNFGVQSADAWYNDLNYGYKKALMIDNTQVAGGSTLTDFPVLISITDSSLRTLANGGRVRNANGYDIVFTEQNGTTKLDHEIESYNAATGAIVMWVKVPNLYACCATQIDMYYGNPNISTTQENKTGVWSNGYAGVWHLGANLNDSTSNGNNGTNVGATTGAEGKVGNGISTNGSTGRVTVADHATLRPSTNLTISAWIKRSGAQDTWGKPVWYGYTSSPPGTYGFQLNNTSDDITGIQIAQATPSNTYSVAYNSQNLNDATWRFIAGTYNGSSLTPFFDGTAGTPVSTSITINHYPNSYGLGMGGRFEGVSSDAFLGNIDEVRVSLVARTSGWITTEYNTVQNSGSGAGKFISSIGGEETPPVPVFAYPQSSAIDNNSALVGAGIVSYVSSPTVTARWGTTNGSCSTLPNTVAATGSNRTDVNNYVSYTARLTGLPSGQTVYWCLQGTTSNGTGYLTTQSLSTQATAATGCDLLPASTLASAGNKTTLAGYLGTSKLKGTLLYRATTNGWTASNFHTASNNQGENIILIRNSANSKVFGAYYPQSWTSAGSYRTGSTGFLFNLTDGYQLKQFMSVYQSYDNANYGPTFGGGHDLAFPNATLNSAGSVQYTNPHSYELPSSKGAFSYLHGGTGNQYFVPNEIEVYKIDTCTTSTPVLSLPTNTSPTFTTVTLGATVDSDGGASITERGVCYAPTATDSTPGFTTATGSTPETGVTCTSTTGTTGLYTIPITGLTVNTPYTYRGYARNSVGNGYSSTGTFQTQNNAPTGVTTGGESDLGSYKVTLNGNANPNGSQAYGYFILYTSVPDCSAVAEGQRFPSLSSQDINLGSGSSGVPFSYTTPPTITLTPSTQYWYCAYSRNVAAGSNNPGTPAAAGYDTFTTPDGPSSGCDAPSSGDLTVSESCTFPQSDYDGVDEGSGTTNTARITLSSGGNITILPGQRIARGSLVTSGGSFSIGNGGGSVVRGGVYLKDSDGDGIIDQPIVKTVANTQPAGYVRRSYLYSQPTYNTSTFNYASKMYNAVTVAPSYLDCDQNSGNAWRFVPSLVNDADNDGYKTSTPAMQQCVGASSTINGRTYYSATSAASMWLPDAQKLSATTDCQDNPGGSPCSPSSLSPTNPSSQVQNTVSWSGVQTGGAVPSATGYDVQWCSGGSCVPPGPPGGTLTSFTSGSNHTGLSANTIYGYRVAAKNTAGTGAYSGTQYVTTQASCTNTTVYSDNDGDGFGNSGTITRGLVITASTDNGSTIVVNKPTDVINGSFMLVSVEWDGGSGRTMTPPAGWTQVAYVTNGSDVGIGMWYRYASSEGASYTWTASGSTDIRAWITSFGNVATSNPIGNTTTNTGGATPNHTGTSLSPTGSNYMLVMAVGNDNGDQSYTPPSGMTEFADKPVQGSDSQAGFYEWRTTSSATGTKTAVYTNNNNFGFASIMAEIKRITPSSTVQCVSGNPSAGWSLNQTDCDDALASYYQNLGTGYPDADGDGVDPSAQSNICSGSSLRPGVATSPGTDCDSNDGGEWQNLTAYVDGDNDGYTVGGSQQVCSGIFVPQGYKSSSSGTDCYDSNSSARPNQNSYFTGHRGDGSFDYNCNSSVEKQYSGYRTCTSGVSSVPLAVEIEPGVYDCPVVSYCTSISGTEAACGDFVADSTPQSYCYYWVCGGNNNCTNGYYAPNAYNGCR